MLLPGGHRGRLQADEAAAGRNERLLREVLPSPAELPLHVAASGPEGLGRCGSHLPRTLLLRGAVQTVFAQI